MHDFGPRRRRYVRNSFKVTVDAVTGDLAFYRVPVHDPLTDAIEAAYGELVRPMSEMPRELREHLRYPRVLLALQTDVLRLYHQETARAFHGGQDVWTIPRELAVNENEVEYEAEYGVYRLPWEDEARFQLTTVFVPQGRENLTAMIIARTDDRGVPELTLLDIPVGDQVSGPRQVESFVEQDPDISEQFSLWRTSGSQVWTGHLHLIPVGNRIVYMEPVYLAAEADAIPELRRFVVSDGRRVVMTQSLDESVAALAGSTVRQGSTGSPEPGVRAPGAAADPPAPDSGGPEGWPAEALRLLERAEQRARAGDWQGYGEALDELRAPGKKKTDTRPQPAPQRKRRRGAPEPELEGARAPMRTSENTCDLRGMRVDEALEEVDRFVDRFLGAHVDEAGFVLHGHGTGALKKAVRDHLALHGHITNARPATQQEGGDAFTVFWVRD